MAQSGLNFVHLSDMHLVKDFSDVSNYDLDLGLRQAILRDIERMKPAFENIAGVLVSGDIAFAGKLDEYERAIAWLNEICDRAKCDRGLVWCVPGNHDVDQSVQKTYPMLLDSYKALRSSNTLDKDLRDRLDNDVNGPLMFEPLSTYHEHFGATYDCPTTPKQPWWEDELILNDGSRLKIRGINSAICSSRDDKEKVNMLLHGVENPDIQRRDSLAQDHSGEDEKYTLVLANPPFAGSLDHENVAKDLQRIVKTKKTELLFLALFIRLLKPGGRAAIIVPDGVLFGSSKAHKELRRLLVEEQKLDAVVSLPGGAFRPYAGVSTAILLFTKTNSGGTENAHPYAKKQPHAHVQPERQPSHTL